MWKIHRCVQRRLVEGWRAAHRTRESSCVSEGWLCHFYGTVHLHTVQQRREHASRCVIELKVAWLRAIFAARRLWNERNVESREFWNRIIYAFRLANWGGSNKGFRRKISFFLRVSNEKDIFKDKHCWLQVIMDIGYNYFYEEHWWRLNNFHFFFNFILFAYAYPKG